MVYLIQILDISSTIQYVKLANLILKPYAFKCNSISAFLMNWYAIKTCCCTVGQLITQVFIPKQTLIPALAT